MTEPYDTFDRLSGAIPGNGKQTTVTHTLVTTWFVTALDDTNQRCLATRRHFSTKEKAEKYAATIAPTREPEVCYAVGAAHRSVEVW